MREHIYWSVRNTRLVFEVDQDILSRELISLYSRKDWAFF